MDKFTFTVSEDEAGVQLRKIIKTKYHLSSRLMTTIKYKNLITLNGKSVPGWIVPSCGDRVSVALPDEKSHFPPEDIPIDVLYEDDDLLIINKQAGITVHPTKGHPDHTIANGIMKYMSDTGRSFKIRFINRLDMDTSGILVIGKNSHAQAEINMQMSRGLTRKRYTAVASGIISEDEFVIDKPIGRLSADSVRRGIVSEADGGYPSATKVHVIKRFGNATLTELELLTGRTHQIRVHLASIGHPLLGDRLYGGDETYIKGRQALHAHSFTCLHPMTKNKLEVIAPLATDLAELIERLV